MNIVTCSDSVYCCDIFVQSAVFAYGVARVRVRTAGMRNLKCKQTEQSGCTTSFIIFDVISENYGEEITF